MKTHSERCYQEATRDVVFLLQRKFSRRSPHWYTESVWLDRDEAESYARAHEYNYTHGWQVYGAPSYGMLAQLLRKQDDQPEE